MTSIDVVIPARTLNGDLEAKLQRCLLSLRKPVSHPMRIIVIDDHSPKRIEVPEGVSVYRSKGSEAEGFAATCNRGALKGNGNYILFLNSDCYVDHGCIDAMADELDRDPTVGVVGALLRFDSVEGDRNRPPNMVQHAGMAFGLDGAPYHIFAGWHLDHPKVAVRREMSAVTGACLLTRRIVWSTLGGFAEAYGKGTYEDIEFCLKARKLGQAVVFTPKATAVHEVGATALSDGGYRIQENRQLFQMRCKDLLLWDEWRYL